MAKPNTSIPLFPRHGKSRQIEVAPGKTIVDLPPQEVKRVAVATLLPTGDPSTYKAVAKVHDVNMRLTAELLKTLGIGSRTDTMRRLIKAGFVDGCRVAPTCYLVNIESYFAHVAAVKKAAEEGREFWDEENLSRYRAAI